MKHYGSLGERRECVDPDLGAEIGSSGGGVLRLL